MSTILLIEDDEDQRLYIAAMLKSLGHQVVEAVDGDHGLQLFGQHRVDLVITDIFMPEKEGLSTIIELKELSPETKIIAMTAGRRSFDNVLDIACEFGADLVLKKPIDMDALNKALHKALTEILLVD